MCIGIIHTDNYVLNYIKKKLIQGNPSSKKKKKKKKEGKNNKQNKTTKTNYKSGVEGEGWIYCISRAKSYSCVWLGENWVGEKYVKEKWKEKRNFHPFGSQKKMVRKDIYVSKYLPPSPPKLYLPKIWRNEEEKCLSIYLLYIILYIIKVGLRRRGCTKWLHQIAEILINF